MRVWLPAVILMGALPWQSPAWLTVTSQARSIQPGELVELTLRTARPEQSVRVRAFDRSLASYRIDAHTWRVLVGIDLDTKPGTYAVTFEAASAELTPVTHRLNVRAKAFPTRKLIVDEAFVNPPEAVQARIEEEARELAALWALSSNTPRWTGPFQAPVPQPANSAFGTRSILNGQPRSPHGGADFASP